MGDKFIWYLDKLLNFIWVLINLLVYLIFHPHRIKDFLFPIFSSINEFFQSSHGGLKNFEETRFYKNLCSNGVFAQSNLFNRDSKVTRSMETHFLSTLVKGLDPATIFEIGTYNGFTTLHMAVNSSAQCRIYTLDLPPDFDLNKAQGCSYDDLLVIKLSQETISQRYYKNHPLEHKITELFGDSATFDYGPYKGKMDLIFIDGNHSTEYVRRDTEHAMQMLSENGVIVWHDFDYIIHKDVFKFLKELSKEYSLYSVPHTRFAVYGKNIS